MIKIHIDITLEADKPITLPLHYNYVVQSAIYNSINPSLAEYLHNTGYCVNKRSFKFFSFSRLNSSAYNINSQEKTITFIPPVNLVISSPIEEFCESLVNTLVTVRHMEFLNNQTSINHIQLRKATVNRNTIEIKTLSPIVVYSTFLKPDGRKYTHYFHPREQGYQNLILNNLINKYKALYNQELVVSDFKINPLGRVRMSIIEYKGFIIKGYSGIFTVSGPRELLQLMIDSGIGSKNSQGFGCIDFLTKGRGGEKGEYACYS